MTTVAFVSGHLDLTSEEFEEHYVPKIRAAIQEGASFIVGDASGADTMAQRYLKAALYPHVTVYHMLTTPRNNAGFPKVGGYLSDGDRDKAMTKASTTDIAWVRAGREKSGTAKNLARRAQLPR